MKQAEEHPSERSGERAGPSPVRQEEAERCRNGGLHSQSGSRQQEGRLGHGCLDFSIS